jgi:uncharacterized protein (TIGR03437 family)
MNSLLLAGLGMTAAMLLPAQLPSYSIRTLAGVTTPGEGGFALNAVLNLPLGKVTADSAGNAYFTESNAGTVRRIGVDGVLTTVAGGGIGSTPALQVGLNAPYALAVDAAHNLLYIGELGCAIHRVNLLTGAIASIAGNGTCSSSGPDGSATAASIFQVTGLALDSTGGLLFSERYGYRVRRLDLAAATMKTILGTGIAGAGGDGQLGVQTLIGSAEDIAVDARGDVFVLDSSNCVVRKIDPATSIAHIVAGTLGKCGSGGEGVAPLAALFDSPSALAVNAAGDLVYVVEGNGFSTNNRIRKVDLGNNKITTYAGTGYMGDSGDGGPASQSLLAWPNGIAFAKNGNLLVSEYLGGRVRSIDSSANIQPFAGLPNAARGDGGPALAALLSSNIVAPDGKGGYVISDVGHRRVRAVSNGVMSLVAGTDAYNGSSGDGGLAANASLGTVLGMAVDPSGPIYIAEATGEIRAITGTLIRSVSPISFNFPQGMALDPSHRFLYVAEYGGNRVVKVDVSSGIANTIAGFGLPGGSGAPGDDGDNVIAAQSHLNGPTDIAVDAAGNIFVTDANNHVIRRISPGGNTMLTVAGNHHLPNSPAADGGLATASALNINSGITVDSGGNVLFAEGAKIRRVIGLSGNLATVAGTGNRGFSGDGGPALSAQLAGPAGMNADAQGSIYFADNGRVRVLSFPATVPRIAAPVVASSFGGGFTIASGTWMEIYGEKLSPTSRQWAAADFIGTQAPSSLDNVQVLIGGKHAYLDVIGPGQINAQVPDGIGTGNVSVQVVSPDGTSDPVMVTAADRSPALLAPPSFTAGGRLYAGAILADGTFAGPLNLVPGTAFRPAHAGERVILYGIGFGAGSPIVPAGVLATQASSLPSVSVTVGGVNATVEYAGQAGGFVGLFQFNIVIPSGVSGDAILAVSVNGVAVQQVLYLTIG